MSQGLMGEILQTFVHPDAVAVYWIGQGGFAFKDGNGTIVLVDPYLSDSGERLYGQARMIPIPILPEEVVADLVISTHEHEDHADPDTLPKIARACPKTVFMAPESVCRRMLDWGIADNRIVGIEVGQQQVVRGIVVRAIVAKHTTPAIGCILGFGNVSIYVTGDTLFCDELLEAEAHKPDVVMVCINGKFGNMNVDEAVRLVAALQPKFALPMHFGMFRENTEDPRLFLEGLASRRIPVSTILPQIGQAMFFQAS